ncbi:MAG TPA: tyrosine-type recombinase/integrase [Planctomycetaceae bacterium]|jgi:integrase|nr:tyrosine-type recombinase/integrase [Planctomycetaceae bacterium]
MAGLQRKGDSWYCTFRYLGNRHTFTIGPVPDDIADATSRKVDLLLYRLKQRLVEIPSGVSVVDFVQFDGKPAAPIHDAHSLGEFRDKYVDTHKASLEKTTLDGIDLHFGYFVEAWGDDFPINGLSLLKLQEYVDARAKDAGMNGRKVSAATIKKEIVTLRTAWNWAKRAKIVKEAFPYEGLRYPRTTEKPPFMTKAEIERHIKTGDLSDAEQADLWDAMYPTIEESRAILKLLKSKDAQPFLHPMVAFAAHTGARRSEIIRVKIADVDLRQKVVTIHEKKRVRGKTTTRRVPLSPALEKILRDWLKRHPGGPQLFCQNAVVRRSKKRSPTTGHQSGNGRATEIAGRKATIVARRTRPIEPLTPSEAHNHLKRALSDTDWSEVRGWHFFRHGFISACATAGIDQRFIEEFAGHMSEEISRRYRHLYPSTKYDAIKKVFG